MPNRLTGSGQSQDIAGLMVDLFNITDPDYDCSGTGVSTSDIPDVLKYVFGYYSASYANYNYNTVWTEVSNDHPVILSGYTSGGDGHAWVCAGYKEYTTDVCTTYLWFWMNWGWNGTDDGWFSPSNFNTSNGTFNNNVKMVYNIRP